MKLRELNPFLILHEHKKAPYARLLRSGLWQRFKDTFFILAGDVAFEGLEKPGLFDYLSLFIFFGLNKLTQQSLFSTPFKFSSLLFKAPIWLMHIALLLTRVVVSAIMVVVLSPIIWAVHACLRHYHADKLETTAASIVGKDKTGLLDEQTTLSQYLKAKDLLLGDIQKVKIEVKQQASGYSMPFRSPGAQEKQYQLHFFHGPQTLGLNPLKWLNAGLSRVQGKSDAPFEVSLTPTSWSENQPAISALLNLNIGGIAHELERTGLDTEQLVETKCP